MLVTNKAKVRSDVQEKMLNGLGVLWRRSPLEKVVLRSIDSAFTNVLGEELKETVLYHLKKSNTGPEDALINPNKFVTALESFLGPGAAVVENEIIKELSSEFELVFRKSDYLENGVKNNLHSSNSYPENVLIEEIPHDSHRRPKVGQNRRTW